MNAATATPSASQKTSKTAHSVKKRRQKPQVQLLIIVLRSVSSWLPYALEACNFSFRRFGHVHDFE